MRVCDRQALRGLSIVYFLQTQKEIDVPRIDTVSTEVFKYEELSDRAKEAARNWYRSCGDCYHWGDDNLSSLEAFADWFGLNIRDYSLGGSDNRDNHVKWELKYDDNWQDIKNVRLWKYLMNNPHMMPDLSGNCPFTGYCMDESLLDPIRTFMQRPESRTDVTWKDLLERCIDSFVKAYRDDVDYTYSDEAVEESIIANEYEFTESGNHY